MSDVSLDMSSISPNGTLLATYSLPGEEREIMGYDRHCGVALRAPARLRWDCTPGPAVP